MSISLVQRLRFDATRCEATFSKGVAGNIDEAADKIGLLREVIKLAREKLIIYREHSTGEYQGGMEHRMLLDLIDKTLKE